MDFLDSLKNIKKEMQTRSDNSLKSVKSSNKSSNKNAVNEKDLEKFKDKTQEVNLDKEIVLKQEKLQNEFFEFIKNSDIKKI